MCIMKKAVVDRFIDKVSPEPNSGCWLWTGSDTGPGYGQFWLNGKGVSAHRFAYELFVGKIPKGLVIDHLCRVGCCVNPVHLEPVTQAENVKRGLSGQHNRQKTHCPQGHEYSKDNTRIYNGKRHCRVCGLVAGRKYRKEKQIAHQHIVGS